MKPQARDEGVRGKIMAEEVSIELMTRALNQGWQVPDESIRDAIEFATRLVNDGRASNRDKIRASELIVKLAESQKRLLFECAVTLPRLERECRANRQEAETERLVAGLSDEPSLSVPQIMKLIEMTEGRGEE